MLKKRLCEENTLTGFFEAGLTLQLKIFSLIISALVIAAAMLLLNYLHGLLSCFHRGDIFNHSAISYAKKAFMVNFYTTAAYIFFEIFSTMYSLSYAQGGNVTRYVSLLIEIFDSALWLGFLILGVWALEMGGALKEESELTI